MGNWLIADVSLFDVHVQVWMLLVTDCHPALVHLRLGNAVAFGIAARRTGTIASRIDQ
jgi:hypothetical protein